MKFGLIDLEIFKDIRYKIIKNAGYLIVLKTAKAFCGFKKRI